MPFSPLSATTHANQRDSQEQYLQSSLIKCCKYFAQQPMTKLAFSSLSMVGAKRPHMSHKASARYAEGF